jgi:acylphosphatase
MRVRRRVVVWGRVQGVWFRGATADRARALGLAGWVRNRADGAVEAIFEGPPEAVEAALAFCRTGPPAARVEHVDVADEPPEGLDDFTVRR